ncbi:MAG: hypothetical protein M3238_02455 [Actinomycetota bacterium]|nr:hypothetical protein [Actinomycetota bacterium]
MVDTVGAVVHGDSKRKLWVVGGLHVLGAGAAAALLGATLAGIGALAGAPWGSAGLAVVAAGALLYLLRETLGVPVPIPEARRQVPEWWRSFYSGPTAAFLFGAGLGVGFATFLGFGTFVVVAASALASGDPTTGAILCAPFGIARAVAAALAATRSPAPAAALHRLESFGAGHWPRAINSVALAGVVLAVLF